MLRFRLRLTAALVWSIFPCLLFAATPSGVWPSFRGPERTAVAPDSDLLEAWPADGPPLLWTARGAGRGYASVAIVGERLYTLGDGPSTAADKDEYLTAFNLQDGKLVWATKTGPAWNNGQDDWQGSRSTPTVDGDRVYVITPHGELVACNSATGSELWRKNLKQDFGGKKADGWGYSESVLIDGERLVCTPGGEKNTVVALDKLSGELIWSTVRDGDRGAGHASIVISNPGGQKVYVQSTGSGPLGIRADDGKLLWTYDIDRTTAVIPTPIIRDDLVFFTAGYKRGGALLRQVPGGSGAVEIDEIYGLKTELSNKHGGVVLVGDYVYGDSDSAGIPFCAELMTGDIKWKQRGSGRGSVAVAAADNRIYFRFTDGTMVLAKASPESYQEVGKFKIPESGDRPSWAHPVIADGKLYLREGDLVHCYDVRTR